MRKITIVTAFPISIPHPRVETEKIILSEAGYEVSHLSYPRRPDIFQRLINYSSFNYFKKHLYKEILESIPRDGIVILYDFHLLPLVKALKKRQMKVIYETIDNMVHLNFHYISGELPFLKPAGPLLLRHYAALEKKLAAMADGVIVNSAALQEYFRPYRTSLIFYTSPFENIVQVENKSKPAALLYLGLFTRNKGATETLALQADLGLPLFIFGDTSDKNLINAIKSNPEVTWESRIAPDVLAHKLSRLTERYRLMGCSIIHPVHFSYATQEANKDQDYLAMGLPIIGNDRAPTLEKIRAGCGILFNEKNSIDEVIENPEKYQLLQNNCLTFYNQHYSRERFKENLLRLVDHISGQRM